VSNELLINVTHSEISIALTEDKNLVEIHKEKSNQKFTVGDIYLARVKKIMNGLNAAFIDVGYERDAFLHYFDLGPQFITQQKFINRQITSKEALSFDDIKIYDDIDKNGKIADVLAVNQTVLVQIAKEPISTKGPRLSSEISIAGRNLVLIPFSEKVSVSQKIKSKEERSRLKNLILSIKPKNFGVIVRTVAKNRRVAVLDEEIQSLVKKWETALSILGENNVPQMVMSEINRPASLLRDILNNSFNSIHVNNQAVYEQVKEYIEVIAPDQSKIVKYYDGRIPMFEHFGIIKQIKALFGKTVTFKSGAYLIIEHAEALTVIDVNSGTRSKKAESQETNALEVNIAAAEEIARQLRLRDMGGIIVVDFIDMNSNENKKKVFEKMREEMEKDRTKHSILPLSKFGLMQITRQRVRPVTNIETKETCPVCDGTGEITPSILFIDEIENHLRFIAEKEKGKISLHIHPYIEGYLNRGIYSKRIQWFYKYKKLVKTVPAITYSFLEYKFFNKEGEEIK
jgi:ribonuclease G